ncbi:MAG: enoyl-CoA hydratase/isomerase family protein [Myxococcales bacterium]|nr:enoyl-CoA hydratase/isomerase family protein [Myxococcales bacterium]
MTRLAVDVEGDGLAVLRMQDEAGKNAFSQDFVAAVVQALTELGRASGVKAVVLCGLPSVFSAGGDREVLLGLADGRIAPYDLLLTRTLLEVPVPTIAAMAGAAVGGGLVFGLACDLVFMAAERRYGCNFMDLGFTPGMGATRLLQAGFGEYVAAEMLLGAQYFRGDALAARGAQVNGVLPSAEVEARALDVGRRLADKPRAALSMLKLHLGLPRRQAFEAARTSEAVMHALCFADPATQATIRENYLLGPSSKEQGT